MARETLPTTTLPLECPCLTRRADRGAKGTREEVAYGDAPHLEARESRAHAALCRALLRCGMLDCAVSRNTSGARRGVAVAIHRASAGPTKALHAAEAPCKKQSRAAMSSWEVPHPCAMCAEWCME